MKTRKFKRTETTEMLTALVFCYKAMNYLKFSFFQNLIIVVTSFSYLKTKIFSNFGQEKFQRSILSII